jgi:hypothetical protein
MRRWRRWWREHGWLGALRVAATGGSLSRLDKFLPRHGYRVVNVLPPSSACGSWDARFAREISDQVIAYFHANSNYTHVILLGRRVMDLFCGRDRRFGWVQTIGRVPALCLPHPSGRNRFWNDGKAEGKVEKWVEKFLASS